mgnify:CR=1 FL=1
MTASAIAQILMVATLLLMITGKTPIYITAICGATISALVAGFPITGKEGMTIAKMVSSGLNPVIADMTGILLFIGIMKTSGFLSVIIKEVIKFGNHEFQVIATPGHSSGSVTFYCEAEHVAFTGDTLFHNSIGRTDFPGGSMFRIINSLRHLGQLPDETQVLPGHGEYTSIGEELAHNPYMDR